MGIDSFLHVPGSWGRVKSKHLMLAQFSASLVFRKSILVFNVFVAQALLHHVFKHF